MTNYNPTARRAEFDRDSDGVLIWRGGGGRAYKDPGEPVKRMWGRKARLTCSEAVYGNRSYSPCAKSPKHDPDANGIPTKCGIHCAAHKAKQAQKTADRAAEWRRKFDADRRLADAKAALEQALRRIALGHNDPRSLAEEVLEELNIARILVRGGGDADQPGHAIHAAKANAQGLRA